MSDSSSLLARILAGGHTFGGAKYGGHTFGGKTYGGNTFGASAPQQGPAPNFLENQMPPAPALPVFRRSPAISPEGLQNGGPPPMPAQQPTPLMAAAAQPQPQMPPMQVADPAYAPGSMPPVTMGQQAPPGSMMGRNELERDYFRQLQANPQGFDTGWLGRVFG